MKCPSCGGAVAVDRTRGFRCEACGWGRGPMAAAGGAPVAAPPARPDTDTWNRLGLLWVAALAICVGPYLVLAHVTPELTMNVMNSLRGDGPRVGVEGVVGWLNPRYWIALVLYVMAADAIRPRVDGSDLGIGGTSLDNPLSVSDDWERGKFALNVYLTPGRVVSAAVRNTIKVVRATREAG